MKFALVLSGGAARGAYHLGVLHFMEENGIQIDGYSGSSVGAIISASHASGVSAKEQLKIFSSNDIKQVLKFNYFKKGLIKIDPHHKILNELLPIENLEDIPKKVYVNAYDTKRKEIHYFDKGDTHTLCMASSALIPIFRPIHYKNMNLIDGGLVDNLPITPFLDKDYKIHTIDLMPRRINNNKRKVFNPIRAVKKRVFAKRSSNLDHSLEHTDYYFTNHKLLSFKMFTFNELNDCFNYGYKEAQKHFLNI